MTVGLPGCAVLKQGYRVPPLIVDRKPPADCFTRGFRHFWTQWVIGDAIEDPFVLEGRDGIYCSYDYQVARKYFNASECTTTTVTTTTTTTLRTLSELAFGLQLSTTTTTTTGIATTTSTTICETDRCEARNAIIYKLLRKSDEICKNHVAGFIGQDAADRLFLGTASLGLTGGASLAATTAAHALSAAATGVTGLNSLITETVYYKLLTPVIASAIRNEQAKRLGVIEQHVKQGIVEYPVDAAITEVQGYHNVCSFYQGITALSDTIAAQATTTTSTTSSSTTSTTRARSSTTTTTTTRSTTTTT